MSHTELVARRLDVAARGIDLVSVIAHVATSSSPLVRLPWEIGQWLGREKLAQHELENCIRKAKGLVIANEHGQALFEDVLQGNESRPVGPLFLQQSGSLGRLLARDPNLNWMISTIACLFQYHRDSPFITRTLASFIVRSEAASDYQILSTNSRRVREHSSEQIQLVPVIAKIVSSVWYNVINAGCDTVPLPSELLAICSRGHYLDADDLSLVVHTITFQCKGKAVLRTDFFLRDVVLWLFYHYDGYLVVTVGGRVVYEKDFGNPRRELEVHVKSSCLDGEPCAQGKLEKWAILQNIAGNLKELLSGYVWGQSDIRPRPGLRQSLYTIDQDYEDHVLYDRGIQLLIKCTAQHITGWLLQTRLLPQKNFSDVGFTPLFIETTTESAAELRICDILYRTPSILQFEWGVTPEPPIIFFDQGSSTKVELRDTPNPQPTHSSRSDDKLPVILKYFPVLQTLLSKVSPHCKCRHCSAKGDPTQSLKPGCLSRRAIEQVLLLLAHSIADGFGVSDISSVSDNTPVLNGVRTILWELCCERKVIWDTWFGLAGSVCLGCPFQVPSNSVTSHGGKTFAAIQYGDLAVIAPWLDLAQQLTVEGCFQLIVAKGRVGVMERRAYADEMEFQSVANTFAIIETGDTEESNEFNKSVPETVLPAGTKLDIKNDETQVSSDTILIGMDDTFYRLLMRFKTPGHWRIIDASDALNAVIRRTSVPSCPHPHSLKAVAPSPSSLHSFEEMIGRWPNLGPDEIFPNAKDDGTESENEGTLYLSPVLDTHLKLNIALALGLNATLIENKNSSCCLQCAIEIARKSAERVPLVDGESGNPKNRYIVNLSPSLGTEHAWYRPKLIQQGDSDKSELDTDH